MFSKLKETIAMIVGLPFCDKSTVYFEYKIQWMIEVWSKYLSWLSECDTMDIVYWCDCTWLSPMLWVKLSKLELWKWAFKNGAEQSETNKASNGKRIWIKEKDNQTKEWMKDERMGKHKKL